MKKQQIRTSPVKKNQKPNKTPNTYVYTYICVHSSANAEKKTQTLTSDMSWQQDTNKAKAGVFNFLPAFKSTKTSFQAYAYLKPVLTLGFFW